MIVINDRVKITTGFYTGTGTIERVVVNAQTTTYTVRLDDGTVVFYYEEDVKEGILVKI